MLDKELISKEFCLWLADNLRAGNLDKDNAEKLVLAFRFGLVKSNSLDDLIAYLDGITESFPMASGFISRLLEENEKQIESQNKNLIVEFAQKFMGEPGIVDFLDEANKTSDLDILTEKFPKFKEFLTKQDN